ncbi:outer membrane lipoprotein carrier protein LolA [Microbulbifer sp. 2304DJ12-6]|uniref:outer membrane lipoprotein carrier protein LolA n=1 Tax=Microbulbifer sp. 2304DJ12-6 TaxID=3233340 RepID=UPI0039AF1E7F
MSALNCLLLYVAMFLMPTHLLALNPEQRQILEMIENKIEPTAQMIGSFSQKKTIPQLPRPLISKGIMAVSEDMGVSWRIESPVDSHRIFWNPDYDNRKNYSTNPIDSQIAYPLLQIIKGKFSTLEDFFFLNAQIDQEHWQVRLLPKKKSFSKIITSIEIFGDDHIRRIVLAEANQSVTEMEIYNFRPVSQENNKFLSEFSKSK